MFKPRGFKKYSVVLLEEDAEKALGELHEEELIELRGVNTEERELSGFDSVEREKFASFNLTRIKRALGILEPFRKKKKPLESVKGFLFSGKIKKEPSPDSFKGLEKETKRLEKIAAEAEEIDRALKDFSEKESSLLEEKKVLEKISSLSLGLEELRGFENIETVIGKMPAELEKAVLERIKKAENCRLLKEFGEKEKIIIFAAEAGKADGILRELRKLGLERIAVPEKKGKPGQLLKKIAKSLKEIKEEREKEEKKAGELLEKSEGFLLFLEELLEIEKSRQSAFLGAGKTEKTMNFDAFVPAEKEKKFLEVLKKSAKNRFYAEELGFEEKEAPVLLKNPVFFRDYEFILRLYGLPGYKSIDPTPFIALVFPLFFGLAFSDIGYGIMLVLMGLFLRATMGRKTETMKHLTNIIVHGGFATIFFGWMFGSFFGDFGGEGIKKMALLDPLGKTATGQSAALVFLGAIGAVGLLHLNIAILLGFREELRKKHYKAAIAEKLVFVVMEGGLLLYVLGEFLGYGALFSGAGAALLLASLGLLFLSGGPLGLMEITGFLGNVLSYLRLAALSLATFAVAMSINIIAGLISPLPYVGALIAAFILIAGHFANFLFNILSSFIHPLRLHFVEFFSYFYEGSGKEFRPYNVKRRFTERRCK